ncbi:alanine--tRNA ligase [Flavobacteriaceae bacterium]|nr:alanine--tRNA ligase [Flavobacteriaceae bacterium]MDA9203805.1 alanine--tRNA ligase [Flavobacteriaceae bacterium]MDC1009672.1 alanine--tRNA ligase [Flavobacteriaceae bacterium]
MNSSVVREKFFQYFKDKGHEIIPSASVINKTDKNLMFTNAGMNQFRNIFTGDQDPKFSRVANSQKCLRVSGKHNDLEEVGVDTYHHTFFEMLGNWSFGDYFKKEIIEWSFDLITNIYGIDKEDLYVSVFEGSKDDNTQFDKETFDEWKKYFSEDKIINGNKKDNFWEMGDTGPCGPCSEIHVDLRSASEKKKINGANFVNKDHPQVVEIWNLVFIQYDRKKDGSLKKLNKQYVDTGMGLERLCMALQGKKSTYETDFFTDIIKEIENISGKKYLGGDEGVDIGIRVISDHLRAIIFTILDGQIPGNTGSGYVIRRILRRAIRYGYTNLDIQEPFLFKLVEQVSEKYFDVYPSLRNQQNYIESVIKDEEKGFLKTLNQGLNLINELINSNPSDRIIKGDIAFKLYDTFGFPIDLTSLIATENNFKVDLDGFNENMKAQKNRSKSIKNEEVSDWIVIDDKSSSSMFLGYDMSEIDGRIIKYRESKTDQDNISYHIVTDKTSFYPEGGGQIGDIGQIISGDSEIQIKNTFKDTGEIIHETNELPDDIQSPVKLKIDKNRRSLIESNHTSTHLLHQALRNILGKHVEQRGSMISDKMFRFDFSHQNKISDLELVNITNFVNEKINQSIDIIENREEDYQIAIKNGAIGLFTEKYEDKVRTIKFNDSYELCGGTHVKNTGDISSFKIISEGSQAFGIRRIVATTNEEIIVAENLKQKALKEKADMENANKLLKKEQELQNKIKIQSIKDDLIKNINNQNDINNFIGELDLDPKSIKELCFMLSDKFENLFLILISKSEEKVFISCFISKNLIEEKELNASKIIRELSPLINGSGGGQPFFATGGGTNKNGIEQVITESKKIITQL